MELANRTLDNRFYTAAVAMVENGLSGPDWRKILVSLRPTDRELLISKRVFELRQKGRSNRDTCEIVAIDMRVTAASFNTARATVRRIADRTKRLLKKMKLVREANEAERARLAAVLKERVAELDSIPSDDFDSLDDDPNPDAELIEALDQQLRNLKRDILWKTARAANPDGVVSVAETALLISQALSSRSTLSADVAENQTKNDLAPDTP